MPQAARNGKTKVKVNGKNTVYVGLKKEKKRVIMVRRKISGTSKRASSTRTLGV